MPTYEYRCKECGERFDVVQSFADDSLTVCPATGGPAACTCPGEGEVTKIFSPPGITFKGDGFYKTDSRTAAKTGSKKDQTKEPTKEKESVSSGSSSDSSGNGSGSTSSGTSDSKTASGTTST